MSVEILETRLYRKKAEIEAMMNDLSAIVRASSILKELGYDNSQLEDVARIIDEDIKFFAKEAVMIRNSYEKAKEEMIRKRKELK
jgi:hypothetical protein